MLKAEFSGVVVHLLKFVFRDAPAHARRVARQHGMILRHQADWQAFAEFEKQRRQRVERILRLTRQNQMARQNAAPGDVAGRIGVKYVQHPLLPHHFGQRIQRDGGIIGTMRQPHSKRVIGIFDIRQIHVRIRLDFAQQLHALIARHVPDDGQLNPLRP